MAKPHLHTRVVRAASIPLIILLAATAATWLAPRVSDAVAAWLRTPAVRSRTIGLTAELRVAVNATEALANPRVGRAGLAESAADAGSTTIDAGLRFTMVGVICRPPVQTGDVVVRVRTSEDGATWSRWYSAVLERGAQDAAGEQAFTEPLWTGEGRYLQVAAVDAGSDGTAPLWLRDVRVVAINSSEDADRGAVVLGVVRRVAATIAGIDLSPPAAAMTTRPTIVTRAQWGADESLRDGVPDYAPVRMAFVHHTDSGNTYSRSEAPAIVRGAYYYHTRSLHWNDIGYNFLVDRYGVVYEGRYGGVTKGPVGAQALGFNTGSTGISVIGTFTNARPPAAAVGALERLLAWKLDMHHVDPLGSATLTCAYGEKFSTGQSVKFPTIAGHRDANYTGCPGGKLYGLLPQIRRSAAALGQPKIYGLALGDARISPNGDGVRDRTTVRFVLSEVAAWRLVIGAKGGDVVRRMSGHGGGVETTWSGKDDDGHDLPDGVYTLTAEATSESGDARAAAADVFIDTTPPHLEDATVTPNPFSPDGDGHGDRATLRFQPGEAGTARVSVLGAGGRVLRRLTGWKAVSAEAESVSWDGRIDAGGALVAASEGPATLEVEMRDLAGNSASVRRSVVVDRTLGFPRVTPSTCSPNGDGELDTATVGFKLTRRAEVTAALVHGDAVLSTQPLGALEPGGHSFTWDGRLDGGAYAGSGAYAFRLTARSGIGAISLSQPFTVDRFRPRLSAPATVGARHGRTVSVAYRVNDPFSPTVRVTVEVTDSAGVLLTTLSLGWVKQGKAQVCAWKPVAKGSYTMAFEALDRGANHENASVKTTLVAR
jgi:hypothetical protein